MLESFSCLTIREVCQRVQENHQLLTRANEHRVTKIAVLTKESHESYKCWPIHASDSQEATRIVSVHHFVVVHLASQKRVVLRNRLFVQCSQVS